MIRNNKNPGKATGTILFATIWTIMLFALQPLNGETQEPAGSPARPEMPAVRIDTPPLLDGLVEGDPVWLPVPASGGFIQNNPDEGRAASQQTEVRVAFTGDTLYIGIICFDDDPDGIIINGTRRDTSLDNTDSLRILLDTYLDGQNGLIFGTNPTGLEYDGQVTREGSGSGFNLNWDGVWQVETHLGDYGWSAEFAIPFRTLRFAGGDVQTWGLNVQRNIRRRNENAYWAPLERQYNIFRVFDAGRLSGIELPSQRNLKFVPYLRSAVSDIGDAGTDQDFETGFDIKYGITPSLTLDLTYNTDFAQVEVDEVQINLDRFNLFFPEKRPFFLENAGQFSVGDPGEVELFFSRRIGISEDGDVIPIVGGVRLSGKVDNTNVGFLYMQTEDFADIEPGETFVVARVNQELPNRSSLGAIFIDRDAGGPLALPGEENQAYGVDGRWGIGEYGLVSGYVAQSSTPGLDDDDISWSLKGDYDSEQWSMGLGYTEVQANFNPEVGFLKRDDYRKGRASMLYRYRPPENRFGLHELRPHFSYSAFYDFNSFKESGFLHIDNHWEFKSSAEIHTGINFVQEGLLEPFEISDGIFVPAGNYHNHEVSLVAFSDRGAPLSFTLRTTFGGFFNGDRVQVSPTMHWRVGDRFTSEWSWIQNDVDLDTGSFVTNLGRIRLSYAFTPKSSVQALFQYNDVDDLWSMNLRYSWLRTANTGLFIVYNDTQGFSRYDGERPNRSLLIKYSHLFEIF